MNYIKKSSVPKKSQEKIKDMSLEEILEYDD